MSALPLDRRDQAKAVQTAIARAAASSAAGAYVESVELATQALVEAEALGWAPLVAAAHHRLGRSHEASGAFDEAERELADGYFVAAQAGELDRAIDAADDLAFVIGVRLARPSEGLYWTRHADVLLAAAPDPAGVREADHLGTRANLEFSRGAYAEAEALHERALAIDEETLGSAHPETASTLNNLANVVFMSGQHARAAILYERACASLERSLGAEHPTVSTCLVNLAASLSASGEDARAVEIYTHALATMESTLGPEHPSVAAVLTNLAGVLPKVGDPGHAEVLYRRAIAIWEASLGADHPMLAHPLIGLATIALDRGDASTALPLAERALALRSREDTQPEHAAEARFLVGRALWSSGGDRARAGELVEQAATFYREHPDRAQSREVERWLANHR